MTALAAALAAFWIVLAARLAILRGRAPALPPPVGQIPGTTVLLPVRDEEENLEACLGTLLEQLGAPEIQVIDDGSTDSTPPRLAAIAARQPRIRPLVARPLVDGWTGKVNALDTAFAELKSPWVLLTDADTRHAPELLARAHAAAAEHGLDALSLAGFQEARGFGENLLTPPVFALLDLLLGDWRPRARAEGKATAANGQYFLIRTAALRTIGGFAAVLGQPLDDVALARALRSGGFRVGFRRAGGALQVRMYRGYGETARGWRRNLALLLGARKAIVAAVAGLAILTTLVLLTLLLTHRAVPLVIGWSGGVIASALARRTSNNDPFTGALFPLDLLALSATLLLATVDRARGRLAPWRGREIRA